MRPRLIASYDHEVTEPEWALGWRWDIVLRGPDATPFEAPAAAAQGAQAREGDR
jgi:protocatechuate 3,4-dioxygenase beta subunit